jgi:hypothetical protein
LERNYPRSPPSLLPGEGTNIHFLVHIPECPSQY